MEVKGWPPLARLIYRELLDYQWTQAHLPDDIALLQRIVGLNTKEWQGCCWSIVEKKFPLCADGYRRNPELEQLRQKSISIAEKRAEVGRRGGQVSAAKRQAIAQPIGVAIGQPRLNTVHNSTVQHSTGQIHVGAGGASENISASENLDSSSSPSGSGYSPRPSDDGAFWDLIDPPRERQE
jgi:hypothetical protein